MNANSTESVEAKIEKLLRMADGNANEHESANALRLAQSLADAHNLDIGTIGKTGARADQKINKGLYPYQRTLYSALAELNHCKCWVEKGLRRGQSYQTRLLGSKMNVAVVQNMADYLEAAVNHMVRDKFGKGGAYFSKDANAYRTGMVDRLVERVRSRRRQEEREREQAKREREARHGASTENVIVLISDVAEAEEAANYDYLNGEGAWDRMMTARREREQRAKDAMAKYEDWALANPEEVARQEAERAAELAKWQKKLAAQDARKEKARQARIDEHGYDPHEHRPRKPTIEDNPAYWEGHADGKEVGLDDQIDAEERKAIA